MASQTSMNIPPHADGADVAASPARHADGADVANVAASPARNGANDLPTITQSGESPPATPAQSNPPQAVAFELASSEKKKNVTESANPDEEMRVESGNGDSSSPVQLSQRTMDYHSELMVMFNATTEDETSPNVEVSKEEEKETSNMNGPCTNSEGHSMSTDGSKSNEQKDESQSNYFPSQSKYNTRKKNKKHSLGGNDPGDEGGDSEGGDDDDDDDDDASSKRRDDNIDEESESDEEGFEGHNEDEVKFLSETTCIYTK